MASIFKFIKDCFTYMFGGGVKEELIKIIGEKSTEIAPEVKDDLLASIMQNNPKQFVEKLTDTNNMISQKVRDELMASIMRSNQPVAETKEDEYADLPDLIDASDDEDMPELEPCYRITPVTQEFTPVTPLTKKDYSFEDIIHTGKIIPSGQFVSRKSTKTSSIHKETKPNIERDWKRTYDRVMNQFKLRVYILERMAERKKKVRCHINRAQNEVIHTGKIIPSDQFVPRENTTYIPESIRYTSQPYNSMTKDWKKRFNLVLNQLKFKQFIKERRGEMEQQKKTISIHNNFGNVMRDIRYKTVLQELKQQPSDKLMVIGTSCYNNIIRKIQCEERRRMQHDNKQHNKSKSKKTDKNSQKMRKHNVIKSDCKWNQHC